MPLAFPLKKETNKAAKGNLFGCDYIMRNDKTVALPTAKELQSPLSLKHHRTWLLFASLTKCFKTIEFSTFPCYILPRFRRFKNINEMTLFWKTLVGVSLVSWIANRDSQSSLFHSSVIISPIVRIGEMLQQMTQPKSERSILNNAEAYMTTVNWLECDENWIEYNVAFLKAEIIRNRGDPLEVHHTVTQDGYILELHRIPFGRNGRLLNNSTVRSRPVFLQHGLMASNHVWLINPTNNSLGDMVFRYLSWTVITTLFIAQLIFFLSIKDDGPYFTFKFIHFNFLIYQAYILADAGYDVWMGNSRGNSNSRKHLSLDPQNEEYWDYS